MKKLLTSLLVISALSLGISVAHSAPKDTTVKANFYDFEDQLIDGIIPKPATMAFNARGKVKFGRLSSLSKSFLPALFATGQDAALR